jgi:DNA-binding protein HU-beta
MNIADLVDHLAEQQSVTKAAAKQAVEIVLKAIVDAATAGDEIGLAGFGKFKVQSKPARTGRNPATGATIQIAASKKLSFTPAKSVKDALNPPESKKKSPLKLKSKK